MEADNIYANILGDYDDRLNLLEYLARHANIRGSIMQNRFKVAMNAIPNEIEQVLKTEASHTQWWNMVDEHLSDDDRARSVSKTHQVTLIVLRFESVLALHRAVLATSKKDAAYNAALQRCISASRSIINTLYKAIQGFGVFDGSPGHDGYEKTPLLWPSFTWAVWMSVFIIFSANAEGQVTEDVTLRLADRSVEILKHLGLRGSGWPEACIVAIQNLTGRFHERSQPSSRCSTSITGETVSLDTCNFIPRNLRGAQSHRARLGLPIQKNHSQYQTLGPVTPRSGTANIAARVEFPGSTYLPQSDNVPINNSDPNISFGNPNTYPYPNNIPNMYNFTNTHLEASGNFLGIGQQSSDNPLPYEDIANLFHGEDINYWLGGDEGSHGNAQFH